MSICLILIPIALPAALAMRVVMGKEKFENWLNSLEIALPTNLTTEADLLKTLKKAGYDAMKWGQMFKTHIKGEEQFFFWELREGRWVAVFSKYDSVEMIKQFIHNIESTIGRKIFTIDAATLKESIPKQTFQTIFNDGNLLIKTLRDCGATPELHPGGQITCAISNHNLKFFQTGEDPFNVEIDNPQDIRQISRLFSNLDEDYKRAVQASTYTKLKQRVQEKGLTVESEEVLEDNSILLTLNIND